MMAVISYQQVSTMIREVRLRQQVEVTGNTTSLI